MNHQSFLSFVGAITFVLILCLRGQDVSPLALTIEGDSLTFQLDSLDRTESWMLQQSTDGESWRDLVPLEGGWSLLGFGVQIERGDLEGGKRDKVFFRAKKFSRHEELSLAYLTALAKWNEAEVTSYSYVVRSSRGWSSYEARYTVVNGDVTEVETIMAPAFGSVPDGVTIENWFVTLESAIEQNAFQINVDWNAEFGYPEQTYIDLDDRIVDEEQGWTISELTPLE
ncbi:MAG: DUF6174 domain-containing protein [Akkermansiaceae bacterium]